MKKPLNKMARNLIILFSVIAAVYIGISISIGIVRHIKSLLIQARQAGGGADLILLMSLLFLGCVLYVLPVLVVAFLPFIYAIQTKNKEIIVIYIVIIISLIVIYLAGVAIFNQTFFALDQIFFALVGELVMFFLKVLYLIFSTI